MSHAKAEDGYFVTQNAGSHPERFPDGACGASTCQPVACVRSAARGVFHQASQPGARGLSDFTRKDKLCVTIGGIRFNHLPYHFMWAFSRGECASVVD